MIRQYVSASVAQLRILGRLARGLRAPHARFRNASWDALERKQCIHRVHGHWAMTDLGKKLHAAGGKLLPAPRIAERDEYEAVLPPPKPRVSKANGLRRPR